jgi:cobalt/nickel transport system permease protein
MRHIVVERWSAGDSALHRRDARVKILALLAVLVAIAVTDRNFRAAGICFAAILAAGTAVARLPFGGVLRRAAVALPFSLAFALVSWIAGDPRRAGLLIAKSYLSTWGAVLLIATTPAPKLLRGLESLGAPRFLLTIAQFVYRYLFVIVEQAQRMRLAALCRGGIGFRAAAGLAGVLFARSYERAESVHRSMLSRGFDGRFRLLSTARLGLADVAFLLAAGGAAAATALLARGLA